MGNHLEFYYKCMESGLIPNAGLCLCKGIDNQKLLLFEPPDNHKINSASNCLSSAYWASGLRYDDINRCHKFTPLRQTIVLFMAAMNNEL